MGFIVAGRSAVFDYIRCACRVDWNTATFVVVVTIVLECYLGPKVCGGPGPSLLPSIAFKCIVRTS